MHEKAKEVLQDLVLLKSTSEDDLTPIVDYVTGRLKKLGLKPKLYGDKRHPAIVAQFRKGGVALSGHLDTVPHGDGWMHEDGEIEGDRFYGRGACDMKAGCASMLLAAEDMVAGSIPFTLCFTTDEETTMAGAQAASKDPAFKNAPAIVVTEPTGFDVVVKEKGLLQFSLKTRGVAAHASMPHLGDNAIVRMNELLAKTEDLQRIPKNPNSEMSFCVTTIKGGTRINVIPSECVAEIDVRYPPDMNTENVLRKLRDRIGKDGYELEIQHELDPVGTDPKNEAVRALADILEPAAKTTSVPYATEMVMFKSANKVLMVCGPGNPEICHCNDEWVDLSQVTRAVNIYSEFCSRMTHG